MSDASKTVTIPRNEFVAIRRVCRDFMAGKSAPSHTVKQAIRQLLDDLAEPLKLPESRKDLLAIEEKSIRDIREAWLESERAKADAEQQRLEEARQRVADEALKRAKAEQAQAAKDVKKAEDHAKATDLAERQKRIEEEMLKEELAKTTTS